MLFVAALQRCLLFYTVIQYYCVAINIKLGSPTLCVWITNPKKWLQTHGECGHLGNCSKTMGMPKSFLERTAIKSIFSCTNSLNRRGWLPSALSRQGPDAPPLFQPLAPSPWILQCTELPLIPTIKPCTKWFLRRPNGSLSKTPIAISWRNQYH